MKKGQRKVILPKTAQIALILALAALCVLVFMWPIVGESFGYTTKKVKVHYVAEIPFEASGQYVEYVMNTAPRLDFMKAEDRQKLQKIFEKAQLGEAEIAEINAKLDELPEDAWIYYSVGWKLKYIYYTDSPGSYGWNGFYEIGDGNAVYLYWGEEEIGWPIDGYI
ncbi:MAG: hypothetical protein IJ716_04260 [Lachnospiraceae bacterium]|nr:hypothetical protein [Lachnospiraceae bacterium]